MNSFPGSPRMWPPYDGRGPTGHEGDGGHHLQAAQAARSLGVMCVTPPRIYKQLLLSPSVHMA